MEHNVKSEDSFYWFKALSWFIVDVDSALGSLHHVDMVSVTSVLGAVCILEMLPSLPTTT